MHSVNTVQLAAPHRVTEHVWPDSVPPVLSICCTTFNHLPYIRRCLDGFLEQSTKFRVEIVVHDDASTDGTADIVREYAARHPALFKPILQTSNQYTQGISGFRLAMEAASGSYLAMCEGDDYWADPTKLQKQVDFLSRNPRYVVCFHDARVVNGSDTLLQPSLLGDGNRRDYSAEEMLAGAWLPTLTRCCRNVLRELPPEFDKVLSGDLFLTVLFAQHGDGKYLDDIQPAAYRRHAGGVWSSLPSEAEALASFNSCIQVYLFLVKNFGTARALPFLLRTALPYAAKIQPEENPLARSLRLQELETRAVLDSRTYKVGYAVSWPMRMLRDLWWAAGRKTV